MMFWMSGSSLLLLVMLICSIFIAIRNQLSILKAFLTVLKRFAILLIYLTFGSFLLTIALLAFPVLCFSKSRCRPEKISVHALKPGDIILTGNNGLSIFSVCIKLSNILTNGMESKYWTHVAVHVGNGELIEAVVDPGVRNTPIQAYFDQGSLIKVYRHKYLSLDSNPEFFAMLVDYCRNIQQKGTKYGFGALIFYALSIGMPNILDWAFDDPFYDRLFGINNKYFCSELAAEAYEQCGHPISQFDGWRVKPSDFMRIPMFEEVSFKESIIGDLKNQLEAAPATEV